MIEREVGILLNNFYFRGLRQFCDLKSFPEPVEIVELLGQGVRRISGNILANCESSVSSIRDLRARHVCLWSVGMFG